MEASTLYEIGRVLGSSLSPADLMGTVAGLMRSGFGLSSVRIQLTDPFTEWTSPTTVTPTTWTSSTPVKVGDVTLVQIDVLGEFESMRTNTSIARAADLIAMSMWNHKLYAESQRMGAIHERNRLAREIHDGLSQKLYSIQLNLAAARRSVQRSENLHGVLEQLRDIELLAQAGLEDARRSVLDLRSGDADFSSLSQAIRRAVADFGDQSGLSCKVEVGGSERPVTLDHHSAFLRVMQELLHNVWKHASATRVSVCVTFAAHHVEIAVVDDGVGFGLEPDHIAEQRGNYGLIGIKERLQPFGGALQVEREPDGGMRVAVIVPS
jgi:signal transduction histidine kinase